MKGRRIRALERKFKSLERELNRTEPTKKELEKTWSFQHSFAGEGGCGVTSYKGEERRIDVPEKFGKEKVTEICEYAFSPYPGYYSPKNQEARKAIEEIFLPDSVIRIRDLAFSSCSSLKRVHIPEQTTEIGIWAFSGNSPELTICAPEGSYAQKYVRERPVLGQGAIRFEKEGVVKKEQFRKYNGESPEFVIENGTLLRYMGTGIDVKVPDGVEVIGEGAFSGCGSLRSAELPETTRTIKANAFYGVHPDCEIVMKGSVLTGPEESENPWKDVLCIWAKKMEPSALPQELRKKAVKGFARHFAETGEMPETVKAAYLQYMKKNCQKLWMDGDCLRVILQEKYITAGKIGVYLDEAGRLGKPEITKALLEYRDKNFSREKLEREEQKTKDKVKDGPSAAELKKIWSTKKREDGTLIITRYKGTDLQVTVPKQIGKSLVTAIGSTFFSWREWQVQKSITEITLPTALH